MKYVVAAAALLAAHTASADELIIGAIGYDEDGGGGHIVAEYHLDSFLDRPKFELAPALAVRLDGDGDAWIGFGVALERRLGERAFIEASLMPGYYHDNDDVLGGNVQFRSLIGIGFDLTERARLSIAIDHLSNAGLEDFNPGSEAVAIRYGFAF